MNKSVLFISALDFKERSIQVIRKTPEFYVRNWWEVKYLVARDNSLYGNYYYEKIINPDGMTVHRFDAPLTALINKIQNHTLRTIISKIAGYLTIILLASKANKILKQSQVDIIYGYEIHGVLATALLRLFRRISRQKVINRFQGTWYNEYLENKNISKLILNWESGLALWLKSDLCIMTDDGTSGDKVMRRLKSKSLNNFKFWTNGVEKYDVGKKLLNEYKRKISKNKSTVIAVTVCRLESWKRIDRVVHAVDRVVNKYNLKDIIYLIVGDGNQKSNIEGLIRELKLEKNIMFIGAVSNDTARIYMEMADIFFSTNDLSNVGNPLLEAIRANKIIFTLNNGDTGSWIKHRINGFIYDIDDNLIENIAADVIEVLHDHKLRKQIISNIKKTEKEKLWTWDERLQAEIEEVEKLFNNYEK